VSTETGVEDDLVGTDRHAHKETRCTAAGLKQCDPVMPAPTQPIGKHTAAAPCAEDNEVKLAKVECRQEV